MVSTAASAPLTLGELARAAEVPVGTVKYYLREGLLPQPVRTSRNMAYYPPDFVERIRLIKRLQEERFMPLRVIKDVLDDDPERAAAQARRAAGIEVDEASWAEIVDAATGLGVRADTPS